MVFSDAQVYISEQSQLQAPYIATVNHMSSLAQTQDE